MMAMLWLFQRPGTWESMQKPSAQANKNRVFPGWCVCVWELVLGTLVGRSRFECCCFFANWVGLECYELRCFVVLRCLKPLTQQSVFRAVEFRVR